MGNDTKPNNTTATGAGAGAGAEAEAGAGGGKGFRSRMNHFLYSGERKHVIAGIVLISAVFSVPWFLMNRGSKHQSHQDYLEKADKARSARLSSSTK